MKDKKIVIAGGTGFIGMAMASRLAKDNKVIVLTRNVAAKTDNSYGKQNSLNNVEMVQWDGKTIGLWVATLEGCDLLINLAGRTVNCRYTDRNKEEIMNSRVDATKVLGEAIQMLKQPPSLWINGASATIYRHAEDMPQDEYTGQIQNDFSVRVCKAWEAAFYSPALTATRRVGLRIAIVLGHGGALVPYAMLARLGLGGRQGSGRQMFSWIHIEDLLRIMEWLYDHKEQEGTYNAAAPGPLPNAQFMGLLRRQYHMPVGIPAPSWLLKVAATLIGTETELLLKSRWVLPTRLLKEGFKFQFDHMEEALNNLVGQ